MSELIAAKAKGDLLERYESEKPPEDAEVTESEYVRELLDDGLAAREQSLYERVGLPARLGAQLEDERRTGETEADVVREVLEDGVEARRADALDAIGADDELREAVDEHREEGEPLDDAARRLLREGTNASRDGPRTVGDRAVNALVVGLVTGVTAGAYWWLGLPGAVVAVLAWAALVAFDDVFLRMVARGVEVLGAAEEIRDELEAAREERPDVEERDHDGGDEVVNTQ